MFRIHAEYPKDKTKGLPKERNIPNLHLEQARAWREQLAEDYSYIMIINQARKLTKEQYQAALALLRARLESGTPIVAWDDETIGNKDTYTNCGMCCDDKEIWPDPATHTWPDDARDSNSPRIYGLVYRADDQWCPFDMRWTGETKKNYGGCFHTCYLFQKCGNRRPPMTNQQALERFDCLNKFYSTK
jgi:hypothetical protein